MSNPPVPAASEAPSGPATGRPVEPPLEGPNALSRCRRCGTHLVDGATSCVRCDRANAPRVAAPVARSSQNAVEPSADWRPRKCPYCGGRLVNDSESCRQCSRVDARQSDHPSTRDRTASTRRSATSSQSETQRDLIPALGYLLALAGFSATFAPGWWLGAGFVTMCCGYALGSTGTPTVRWRDGLTVGLVLSLLGATVSTNLLAGNTPAGTDAVHQPFLEVTVRSSEQRGDELIVRGTVRNTGRASVFSPSIELNVYDTSSGTLVAAETAYPANTIEAWFLAGAQASFQHVAPLPAGVGPIEWAVSVEDAPGSVTHDAGGRR